MLNKSDEGTEITFKGIKKSGLDKTSLRYSVIGKVGEKGRGYIRLILVPIQPNNQAGL